MNFAALKNLQENLNSRGSNLILSTKKLGEETDIRLIPPLPNMNGVYNLERITYWINNKHYVSPETFDRPCPIAEEIQAAKEWAEAEKDDDLKKLLNNKKGLKKVSEFWMPILLLKCIFTKDNELESFSVVDTKVKVFSCGAMLLKAINRIVTARTYQNGTPDGIADREKGCNIIIQKSGSGIDTEYSAIGWTAPTPMDEKYYDEKAIPDVIAMTEKQIKSEEHLRSVIRNYLYGEEIVPDTSSADDDGGDEETQQQAAAPAPQVKKPAPARAAAAPVRSAPAPRGNVARAKPEPAPKEVAPAPSARPAPASASTAPPPAKRRAAVKPDAKPKAGERSVLSDLQNLDDE